jgi:hypothetical protein
MIEVGYGTSRRFLHVTERLLIGSSPLGQLPSSTGEAFDRLASVCLYSPARVEEGYEKRRSAQGRVNDRFCKQQL